MATSPVPQQQTKAKRGYDTHVHVSIEYNINMRPTHAYINEKNLSVSYPCYASFVESVYAHR